MKTKEARDMVEIATLLVAAGVNLWMAWNLYTTEIQKDLAVSRLRHLGDMKISRSSTREPTEPEITAVLRRAEEILKEEATP